MIFTFKFSWFGFISCGLRRPAASNVYVNGILMKISVIHYARSKFQNFGSTWMSFWKGNILYFVNKVCPMKCSHKSSQYMCGSAFMWFKTMGTMSSKRQLVDLKEFECPVCTEYILMATDLQVLQQCNGHSLCQKCIHKVQTCPICPENLPSSRPYL